jgi:hypothetical protein
MFRLAITALGTFFIVVALSGVRLSSLGTAATICLLYHPQMIDDDDFGEISGMKIGRAHDVTRARTRVAAVESQRLPPDLRRPPFGTKCVLDIPCGHRASLIPTSIFVISRCVCGCWGRGENFCIIYTASLLGRPSFSERPFPDLHVFFASSASSPFLGIPYLSFFLYFSFISTPKFSSPLYTHCIAS